MKAKFPSRSGGSEQQEPGAMEKVKNFFAFGSGGPVNEENNANENTGMLNKIKSTIQNSFEVEKSYKIFFILLIVGMGLIFLSLIFLPVALISPQKFVSLFSLGSIVSLSSFIFVYGTAGYLELLFSRSRVTFTLLFISSIFIGLYFSFFRGNYVVSLICALVQLITLIIFTLSFIPGGQTGISFIFSMISAPFSSLWMKIKGGSYLPSSILI